MDGIGLRKKILFTAVISLAALVIMLLAGEVFVRLFSPYGIVNWGNYRNSIIRYDSGMFSRYNFARAGRNTLNHGMVFYVNHNGYRGPDFQARKPKGVTRIMVYGGSTAFDATNTEGKDWPRILEKILRENGYPNVEVINAGVPGSASFDSFGRFFGEGHLFQPDYVIHYGVWNDLKTFDVSFPLLRYYVPMPENDPVYYPRNWLDKFLGYHSQLYFRLRIRYAYWRYYVTPEGIIHPRGPKIREIAPNPLRQYKITLLMFADLARNIGAEPVFVSEATLISPRNTESDRKRIQDYTPFDHEGLVRAYEECEKITREVAGEKHAYLIDAYPQLSGRGELFVDHVHLSEKGSQVLAEFVARELIKIFKQKETAGKTGQ